MSKNPRPLELCLVVTIATWASITPACRATDQLPKPPAAAPAATVANLLTRDLISSPGKEVVMLTVQYPGAGSSLPHRHDAQVFVYVLEGQIVMQVQGSPAVTLNPGDTFYEGPDDVHVVSANKSPTTPAKILVVMIKNKGAPASRPAE